MWWWWRGGRAVLLALGMRGTWPGEGPAFSLSCPAVLVLEFGSIENESPIALPWGGPSASYVNPSAGSRGLQHRRSPHPVPRELVELSCVYVWWLFYWSIVDLQCCVTFCCTHSYIYKYIYTCMFSIVQLFYDAIRKHCRGRAGRERLRTHGWAGNKHHGPVAS